MATTTTNDPDYIADIPDKPDPKDKGRPPKPHKPGHSPFYWLIFVLLILLVAALIFFFGYLPRHRTKEQIDKEAQQRVNEVPKVQVVRIERGPAGSELMIPGTTLAYKEAYIYARASGYVSSRLVDIGDHVRQGQLLATIDAPDLDKQVAQARSTLHQSESNLAQMEAQLHLASLTWDRYKVLVAKGVFSRQDGDTQEANYRVAEANVTAAQNTVQANRDNLERLIVLQQYERVTAPFDGVITDRNVDVGALINSQGSGGGASTAVTPGTTSSGAQGNNAGASGAATSSVAPATGGAQGGEMFAIASIDPLRILVSVPEAYSPLVHLGEQADLYFDELPTDTVHGTVSRTSGAVDQNTRTLLVEVHARNPNGRLMPGMYAEVNFVQLKSRPPITVPGEAIAVRNGKNTLAVVENGYVHFRPIQIGRDYGTQSEIVSGVKEGDLIVTILSDEVRDGVKVDPQIQKQKNAAPKQQGAQSDREAAEEGRYGDQSLSNDAGQGSSGGKKGGSSQGGGKQGGNQKGGGGGQK